VVKAQVQIRQSLKLVHNLKTSRSLELENNKVRSSRWVEFFAKNTAFAIQGYKHKTFVENFHDCIRYENLLFLQLQLLRVFPEQAN
jgi:hypothetical protein